MNDVCAIIMAAGKGTRMKSTLPKVLHTVLGKPMIGFVLDNVSHLGVGQVILVVGHGSEAVVRAVGDRAQAVVQEPQMGTGHALQVAAPHIRPEMKRIMVLSGDQPLISAENLTDLLTALSEPQACMSLLTVSLPWANDLGRIVRDAATGSVSRIVEAREASPEQRAIAEVNLGTYAFTREALDTYLPRIGMPNAQKEIYITDMVLLAAADGRRVAPIDAVDPHTSIGVNSRKELAQITQVLRERINEHHMAEGVTIVDPASTFIHPGCHIGRDTTLLPFTLIEGATTIGEGCVIGPSTRIVDSRLGSGVTVQSSIVVEAAIGDDTSVGPFAYLRPGTDIGRGCKIGDFVEIKKARIDDHSKVPHLAYVGDAHLGSHVNIGAGTITCNYDGKNKHHTEIEDHVHIGANTNLVAPVRVGRGSKTGAGSVVTRDVPENAVAVGVPARVLRRAEAAAEV
ncbi:MAG: UDP-N-acetylglucosamine diphosphorylase/glucosamine-1-phosphate N-acetyltransferase [Proteobacteria bacterium]|nr:UDP-N-acetylglucosamine diphosphorylase/glucosamine-1-phosphate N-acetyltransferase [Pseudomonadota bacterium]